MTSIHIAGIMIDFGLGKVHRFSCCTVLAARPRAFKRCCLRLPAFASCGRVILPEPAGR